MSKYIDYKTTIWQRMFFDDKTDMNKLIKRLESGEQPNDLTDADSGFQENQVQFDTDEFITVEENDGYATISVYDDTTEIWDNSYESEIKRKEKQ